MTNTAFETSSRTTNELIAKKKMPTLWSCLASTTDDEKRGSHTNKKINAKLKKDKKVYKATYRLLLLGEPFAVCCESYPSVSFRRRRVRQVNRCQTDENPTQSIHSAVRRARFELARFELIFVCVENEPIEFLISNATYAMR